MLSKVATSNQMTENKIDDAQQHRVRPSKHGITTDWTAVHVDRGLGPVQSWSFGGPRTEPVNTNFMVSLIEIQCIASSRYKYF